MAVTLLAAAIASCGSADKPKDGNAGHVSPRTTARLGLDQRFPDARAIGFDRGWLNVVKGHEQPSLPFLTDDIFRLRGNSQGYPLRSGPRPYRCSGSLAVRSPDGRYVLYSGRGHHKPALKLLDLQTQRTSTFKSGACDPAWSHDNQIAYLRFPSNGTTAEQTRIVVRQGIGGTEAIWVAGSHTPLMWAGDRLITASSLIRDPGALATLARPNEVRPWNGLFLKLPPSHYGGAAAHVVALDSSGDRALIDVQQPSTTRERDQAVLVRTRDGSVLSRVLLPRFESALASDGYWSGDQIVTAGSYLAGETHYPPRVITIRVRADQIQRVSIFGFHIHGQAAERAAQGMATAYQPRFLGAANEQVGIWTGVIARLRPGYARCDLASMRCVDAPVAWRSADSVEEPLFISNPSRP
jgi:hypothetical protein